LCIYHPGNDIPKVIIMLLLLLLLLLKRKEKKRKEKANWPEKSLNRKRDEP
jgi:hypothetical protein